MPSEKKRNYNIPFGGLHLGQLQIAVTLFANTIGLVIDELAPSDPQERVSKLQVLKDKINRALLNADVANAPIENEPRAMHATALAVASVFDVLIAEARG